jgi:hypothetical protein
MTRLLFVVIAWMLPVSTLLAQAPLDAEETLGMGDPPYGYLLTVTRVARPGTRDAVEEFFTRLRAAEAALGVPSLVDVYEVRGADRDIFVSRRGLSSFAEASQDTVARARRLLSDVYGGVKAGQLLDQLTAATSEVTTEIAVVQPERNAWRYPAEGAWRWLEVRRSSRAPRPPQAIRGPAPVDGTMVAPPPPFVRSMAVTGETATHVTTLFFHSLHERHAWASVPVDGDADPDSVVLLEYRPDLSRPAYRQVTRRER